VNAMGIAPKLSAKSPSFSQPPTCVCGFRTNEELKNPATFSLVPFYGSALGQSPAYFFSAAFSFARAPDRIPASP
jgi:hypothetical protein